MMILQDRALREYAKKINRVPEVKKKYSAEELSGLFQQKYQIFDETREIVWQMCLYFAQDNRCELNLEKGLLLAGGVGCGKTTLMRFFANIQPNHYQMKSVREISYEYAEHGEMILKSYSNGAYCFDDMGTESNKKHFGNESNVLEDIISNRYDSESLTHITTNLRSEDIEEAYGIRVRSRLRSMVNLIDFKNAKDLRK